MSKFFGFGKNEILRRVGLMDQVAGVRRYNLLDGNERDVEAIDFRTGTGFDFTVVPGRGMDITSAFYRGKALAWLSQTGVVHPAYFEPEGLGWLRTFYGGLVATCGMTTAGAPCVDQGEALGLHGRFSTTPAKNVVADTRWDGDEYVLFASGRIVEASVFGANLRMDRTIEATAGKNVIRIHDKVENIGYLKTPHMYLYHINLGFPVVSENSRLYSPTKSATPRDAEAEKGKEKYAQFDPPTPYYKEKVYYHDLVTEADGTVKAAIVNENLEGDKFGVSVTYNQKELPFFTEWKMMGEATYVVGLEPANCRVEGRVKERERGTLVELEPGEFREYHVEIGVLENAKAVDTFLASMAKV